MTPSSQNVSPFWVMMLSESCLYVSRDFEWIKIIDNPKIQCQVSKAYVVEDINQAVPISSLRPYHIETSVLVRSTELSNIEHGQYREGRHLRNTRCCKLECTGGVMDNGHTTLKHLLWYDHRS